MRKWTLRILGSGEFGAALDVVLLHVPEQLEDRLPGSWK
jgi:hypothetical protein